METRSLDGLALRLIRAMEPALRKHLGDAATDRDLISELYLRLRRSLSEPEHHAEGEPARTSALAHELALTVYMIAAARVSGSEVGPDLLESLRRTIAREFSPGEPSPHSPTHGATS